MRGRRRGKGKEEDVEEEGGDWKGKIEKNEEKHTYEV